MNKQETNIFHNNNEIICENVSFAYTKDYVLENITGIFPGSTMSAIVGPNGCGKTTLIKIISGHIKGYSGACYRQTNSSTDQRQLQIHDDKKDNCIAYMSQQKDIDKNFPLTVFDVAAQGILLRIGLENKFTNYHKEEVMETLSSLRMSSYASNLLSDLSGGQRQRVFFARLALQKAAIMLLDEPFAAVDPYTLDELLEHMYNWQKAGAAIVMISHDLDVVRNHFQNTLLLVKRQVAWGKTNDVLTAENMLIAKNLSKSLRL